MTKPLITLTAHQVTELAAFIGDQALIDDEPTGISMALFEESQGEGGELAPAGLYVWFTEQPEEGRVLLTRVRDETSLCAEPLVKNSLPESASLLSKLSALISNWETRSRDALPSDAMLMNKHIRELNAILPLGHRDEARYAAGRQRSASQIDAGVSL